MINRVVHLTGSTQKEQRRFGNIVTAVIGSRQHLGRPASSSKMVVGKGFVVACT
jgi:hypothetical protein